MKPDTESKLKDVKTILGVVWSVITLLGFIGGALIGFQRWVLNVVSQDDAKKAHFEIEQKIETVEKHAHEDLAEHREQVSSEIAKGFEGVKESIGEVKDDIKRLTWRVDKLRDEK